ncbi:MAG: hypothetical protein H7144_00595 [Burkholderiales bacterium]|nr:hypothetical protein [Phycisphaerae bacterium]
MDQPAQRHVAATLIAAFAMLLLALPAIAGTTLDIDAGFDGRFRYGRWSPVVVTVSGDEPCTGVLELRVPTGSESIITIRQHVGVGLQKQRYVLYAPVSLTYDPLRATLRDDETGKLLAEYPERDRTGMDRGNDQVGFVVLTSGRTMAMQGFQRTGSVTGSTVVAHVQASLLPTTPIGYDAADVLLLNNPEWAYISSDQQRAMIAWVRTGGTLILQPGVDPIPDDAPLLGALPGKIEAPSVIQLTQKQLTALGLADRFKTIGVRAVVPHAGARLVSTLGGAANATVHRVGLGSVMILPVDASTLVFTQADNTRAFWNGLFDGVLGAAAAPTEANYGDSTEQTAAHAALDRIGDIPNTGAFGFSYIAITVGALMLIVGPIDFFVLKKIGRQPWTWATTLGWIGLATTGALYAGHAIRSGDLHFRTLRFVEQVDDRIIAADDVALVYSPRSARYNVRSEPAVWWQPVPNGNRYSAGSAMTLPTTTDQDYRGNLPAPMWIDIWNWRFLYGRRYLDQPAMIEANLTLKEGVLSGSITNKSDRTLTTIQLKTATESAAFVGTLPPSQTRDIRLKLAAGVRTLEDVLIPPPKEGEGNPFYGHRQAENIAYESLFAISEVRQQAVTRLLKDGHVAVFATIEDPTTDLIIDNPTALIKHAGMLRAIVRLTPAP